MITSSSIKTNKKIKVLPKIHLRKGFTNKHDLVQEYFEYRKPKYLMLENYKKTSSI